MTPAAGSSLGETPTPLRVLYVVHPSDRSDCLTPYSFIDAEIEGLAGAGVEPYVLSFGATADHWRNGVRIVAIKPRGWANRLRTLPFLSRSRHLLPRRCVRERRRCFHAVRIERHIAEAVREYDIDLIHTHFGPAFGFGGMLARAETGCPLVVSFRGMDLLCDRSIEYGLRLDPFFDQAVNALIPRIDFSTYASEFMRSVAIGMGASEETAMTIRKGVDLQHFRVRSDRGALREELKIDAPMILTVVGLIKRKGVDVILRALARLRDTHDFQFIVCGKGPEADALERLSRDLGLAEHTRFVGQVSRAEIPKYFAACDIFVLASHIEAAGNVLLEAMASGRPVICTDAGGPPEYVREGTTGFIVPPAAPEPMAEKIRVLLDDPELRCRLGEQGRKIAEREHPYSDLVKGYLDVYRQAMSTGANAGK